MPKIIESPREAILEHAKKIVLKDGYDQLTIRNVAKDAEVSIGTVYNYFPTKRDLMVQLLEDYWNSYLITIDEIDMKHQDMYDKLHEFYKELEVFVKDFREIWVKNYPGGHKDNAFTKRNDFMEKLNKRLEKILEASKESGSVNLPLDTYTTSKFIIMNFFMMAMMNQFDYESFEKILKKLFQ